jgi:pimeloyl-ACP methyl ester carboxylesterase
MKNILPFFIAFVGVTHSQAQSKPDTASSGFYQSFDGTKIYYEVHGEGKAVVFIHGFTNTGDSWKKAPVYSDLLHAGYKLVTVDLRGNGKSDKPHTLEAYQNDAEAKDIIGLMKMLKLKKYTVIGYSRGAIIASRVLMLSKKVQSAVIGGMGVGFMDTAWARRKMFYRALLGEPVPELEAMIQYVKKNNLDQLALAYSQGGQPSTSAVEFSKVKKPVAIICGEKDDDHESAKELATFIPHARFVTVPGDHNSAMRTQEFSTGVLVFLKQQ